MSDIEEQSTQLPINGSRHSLDTTITTPASTTIRYSKHVLLSLHDSPLVSKPDSMPSLSSWFSEETGSPAVSKNILNGSVSSRSSDKSIVLGPPKTNFASSLYGGLKHTTDTNSNAPLSTSKLSSTSRLRQSEDSTRTHGNSSNGNSSGNRMPRGPNYVGEKGFHHYNYHNNNNSSSNNANSNGNIGNNNSSNPHHHHHHHHNRQEKSGLERRTSNPYGNSSSSHNKRYSHSDHHQGERQSVNASAADAGRREFNRDQRSGHHRSNHSNHNDGRNQERVPEWMDYNPDIKKTADLDDKSDRRGEFANDLEAWKSSMKKKEGLTADTVEKQPMAASMEDPLPQDHATSDAMEKILGLGSLELKNASSPIAPFVDSPNLPSPTSDLSSKRGSRFAKFFAKRGEAAQVPPSSSPLAHETSTQDSQPRSISVNDLFQTPGGGGIGNLSEQQQQQSFATHRELNGNSTHSPHGQDLPPNARVLSEEDVLQSLGAKKAVSSSEPPVNDSDKDAIGFSKVLQILSQSKPTVPGSTPTDISTLSPSSNASTNITDQDKKRDSNETTEEVLSGTANSPTVKQRLPLTTETTSSPSTPHGTSTTPPPAAKPKKVSNLFGGNLPTSVLRQMSARSEGRSPSLASTKSGQTGRFSHSGTSSQNGSPLIGNASPSSPSAHMTLPAQHQHQHHQQQPHTQSPSNYSYQQAYALRTTAVQHGNVYPYPHQHHDLGNEGSDRPMVNDVMLMNTHVPRNQANNGYDMMVQQLYGSGENGMAPRPLPPNLHQPGSTMNGQMNRIMSPKFTQQQQQQMGSTMGQSYMNTHPHPPPPPPMMGMPGAHPMMSPHMSMRLQGQAGNAGNVVPPPFMQQPLMPGMPPPPPMGMPQQQQQQQMYTNKNHGWNRQ